MTLLLRRKRPTTRQNSPPATVLDAARCRGSGGRPTHAARRACRKLLAAVLLNSVAIWLALASQAASASHRPTVDEPAPLADAVSAKEPARAAKLRFHATHSARKATATHETSQGEDSVKRSPVPRAQATRLRWSPYRPTAEAPARDASRASTAASHREEEADHVAQTAGTKPAADPFADPFFDLGAKSKLKVEPVVAQPAEPGTDNVDPFQNETPETPAKKPVKASAAEPSEPTEPAEPMEPAEPSGTQPPLEMPDEIPSESPSDLEQRPQSGEPPSLEESIAQGPSGELPKCKTPEDLLKRIRDITTDISAEAGDFPPECPLGDMAFQPRSFAPTAYCWKASGLCHKPLYFEDVALERYGHSWGPIAQPFISGAHFFVSAALLPYQMGIEPPLECVYVLGYYRPGSCAPKMIYPVPISIRGGLCEAAFIVTGAVVLP